MAPTGGLPENASAAMANDWTIASVWTVSSSLRLSDRSATRPAHGPRRRMGPNWAAASTPRAMPLFVILRTNSVWATSVSQLPTWETSWP